MRVRVYRVSSYTDPETGRPGKIVELVEVRRAQHTGTISAGPDEFVMAQRLLQSLMAQLQGMGLMPPQRDVILPKVTLILTEEEYDLLGVKLEVNEEFNLEFSEGKIIFRPV